MNILAIDHFQVSIPNGKLAEALAFYVDVLGFIRVAKPAELSQTGAWLTNGESNSVALHLGEENDFSPAPRAHPALRVANIAPLLAKATAAGCTVRHDCGPNGYIRASVFDPFNNRIELMQRLS